MVESHRRRRGVRRLCACELKREAARLNVSLLLQILISLHAARHSHVSIEHRQRRLFSAMLAARLVFPQVWSGKKTVPTHEKWTVSTKPRERRVMTALTELGSVL